MSYFQCDYCNDNEVYIEVDDIPESVTCYKCHISHLEQELQKMREQLEKALIHLKIVLVDDTTSDQFCDAEEFLSSFKDKQGE